MKVRKHPTFQQVVESSRKTAADNAWCQGEMAAALYHSERRKGRTLAARRFAELKAAKLVQASVIDPRNTGVKVDSDYQIGMLSISRNGKAYHLPADTQFRRQSPSRPRRPR